MLEAMWQLIRRAIPTLSALLLVTLCLSQESSNPWGKSDLLDTTGLVQALGTKNPPTVICVAFPVLYRGKHISHSVFAGPGSKPEGIEMLKAAVAKVPKDGDLVI